MLLGNCEHQYRKTRFYGTREHKVNFVGTKGTWTPVECPHPWSSGFMASTIGKMGTSYKKKLLGVNSLKLMMQEDSAQLAMGCFL